MPDDLLRIGDEGQFGDPEALREEAQEQAARGHGLADGESRMLTGIQDEFSDRASPESLPKSSLRYRCQ